MRTTAGVFGGWNIPSATATGGTAFTALIPPDTYPSDPNGQSLQQSAFLGGLIPGSITIHLAGWYGRVGSPTFGVTHVTDLVYTTGTTAHAITMMQPKNFTYTTAASLKNVATLTIAYDPGVYSTNFAYNQGQIPSSVADNAIANTDYVAFQLADGTWFSSKVTSYVAPTLTLVTTLPNPTGVGGVAVNTPVFFFGQASDVNPCTGLLDWTTTTTASAARAAIISRDFMGGIQANHAGDPLLFFSPNTAAAGSLDYAAGAYWKW